MASVPPPVSVPPVQSIVPLTVRVPAVLRVPPLIVRFPEIDEADAIASDPFERFKVASLAETVKLLTTSAAEPECVTVMPDRLITTSSDVVGTARVLQLDEVS